MSNIDKLRSTYPVPITFHAGEQPDAAKLSSISSQAKLGLNIIEKAIGDIWGTGDSGEGLHLTNLGRALGEAKYINPALFNVGDTRFFYIENLGSKFLGKTTGYLTFRPANTEPEATDALSEIKFSNSDGTTASATHVTPAVSNEKDVDPDSTTVFVDIETGRFRTGKLIGSNAFVGYWVDPKEWIQGSEEFYPGIIPDPRCDTSALPIQGDAANGYYFEIPTRQPIKSDEADPFHKLSNLPERRPVENLHSTLDWNDAVNLAQATYFDQQPRFWDTSGTGTEIPTFHRYNWPEKASSGSLIPGSIHLWDSDANSIVEGLEFEVNTGTSYRIDITDTKGRLNWALTQDPAHSFYLITHGSSLSRTVWSLVTALANHDHTGVHYNESNLDHSALLDLNSASNKDSVIWEKSEFPNDDHVQYLHRDGLKDDLDVSRDSNKGAMLGDFIIGQTTAVAQSYLGNLSADTSNKIWFGDNVSGTNPSIHGSADKVLNIDASVVTTGYTKSTYFSADAGTSNTDGYTFDLNITGGTHPDPSLLGFQHDTVSNELLVNSPNSIVLKLDTNETTNPPSDNTSKFAINNGAGAEVFKVEESGDISGPSGILTVAGDLDVTADASAVNMSLSERLDLDHASLLPAITTGTPSSSGNSPAGDYVYAIQVKLLNGQYSNVVETEVITLPANNEVSVTFQFPKNTASYKLFRMEFTEVETTIPPSTEVILLRVNINLGSFEKIFNASELDVLQDGFAAGDMQSLFFVDGTSSTIWDTSSIGAWTPETTYPPLTVDNTTSTIDTNASIETMGDIHAHGNLSNLCPEGNIAVTGIRFKSNSDTSSSSMITGIKQETISQTGNPIAPAAQVVSTIANSSFDTASKLILAFRPAAAVMPGSLGLDYWYVDETTDELVYALHSHIAPGGSSLTFPTSFVVVYIEYGDFYA